MQFSNSYTINYNFKDNKSKDNVPEWMNDELFKKIQASTDKQNTGIVLNKKQEAICAKCGRKLAYNEVAYCSSCSSTI